MLIRLDQEQNIEILMKLYKEFQAFHVHEVPDRLRMPATYNYLELRRALERIISNKKAAIFVAALQNPQEKASARYLRWICKNS